MDFTELVKASQSIMNFRVKLVVYRLQSCQYIELMMWACVLASYVDGLLYINKQSGQVISYANNIASKNLSSVNKAMSITSDSDKNIWVGTNGAGVQVFHSQQKKWIKQFLFHEEDSTGIANNWVNCIINDNKGHIWAGTYEGASKINIRTGKVNNYRKSSGGILLS